MPNILELERFRSELIEKTLRTSSNNLRLLLYHKYFDTILSLNRPNFEEAFLREFLDDYTSCICKYEVWGIDPEFSQKLLKQITSISQLQFSSEFHNILNSEIERIKRQLEKQNLILEGKDYENTSELSAFFPLIDRDADDDFYGIVDSVTVRISKSTGMDKPACPLGRFIIVPSEMEIEKKILEQCKKSWILALNLAREYVKKPNKHHEVIISFDKKQGFYEGNSLGTALTISFLEQILKFYNPVYIINIKEQSAFTGGVTETGEVLCTGEEIIKRKVAAVFFSEINTFVFPKYEETYAYFALTQLKQKYPQRKLKLIPVEDFTDVLNRRDIVDIKKQKLVVRTGKFVKKNWISAFATVLLSILFAYLFVMDFDDNPASLEHDSHTLYVKNKKGRILWTLTSNPKIDILVYPELIKNFAKILDINNDTENELLFIKTAVDEKNKNQDRGTIICFDSYQKIKWKYTFRDTVYSERENLQPLYDIYLIDTTTIENKKTILCYANNSTSFSSAIFALDLNTGERVNNTQWNSGFTWDAVIVDIDENGERESIVAIGADNGFNDGVIYGVKLKNLNGFRPTTPEYKINNLSQTELIFYIRIPKTDYDILRGDRVVGLQVGSLDYNGIKKEFHFTTLSAMDETNRVHFPSRYYKLNINTMQFDIYMIDKFSSLRDSLVTKGKLKPPYTDTKEYKEIIKNNILYWKDGEWVKRRDFE